MITSLSRKAMQSFSKKLHKGSIFTELLPEQLHRPPIKCRNRPFLAGSKSNNFPEYISSKVNPYFQGVGLNGGSTVLSTQAIGEHFREYIDENIDQKSAFLLRGLPFNDITDFQELIRGMNYQSLVYDAGTAARKDVADSLYTASDEPADISIEAHNEMSYLEKFPSKIMFCCVSAADDGGDSPVVFNRDIKRDLSQTTFDKVKVKQIRYIRNLSHKTNSCYLTWQETFKTDSEKKAEKIMKRENMSWEWQPNGDLSIWNVVKATIEHPKTKEEIWFNQITAAHASYYKEMPMNQGREHLPPSQFPLHTCYGDGEEIEDKVVDEIRSATWNNAMALKLERGDVLILDNLLCMHSRMSYKGGERKLVVNLSW